MDTNTAIGPTIQLRSGNYFNFYNPWQSKFNVYDIAAALSKICRFAGHCRWFYSVAEHAVNASNYVQNKLLNELADDEYTLTPDQWYKVYQTLHHDDPEFAIGDIASPLKQLLKDYKLIEDAATDAVLSRMGINDEMDPIVKEADLVMLKTEQRQLMPDPGEDWEILKGYKIYPVSLECMRPRYAEIAYLDKHFFLCEKLQLDLY